MFGSSANMIVRSSNEDIISDLPENVTDMILEAMPIRDAARTSVLSRTWQNRWVRISKLDFDLRFFTIMSQKYSNYKLKDIINTILLLHTSPIRTFTLHIPGEFSSLEDNLSPWLRFLSRNGIKEFSLYSYCKHPYKLGLQLFSCLELTHLNVVANCKLNPPANFEGFPNLTTLELSHVSVNGKFGDAISACPLLQRVSIQICEGIHNLVVRAPNLKYLLVLLCEGLKTISLNSTKCLDTLSIGLTGREKLHLRDNIVEFSGASSIPKRLPTSLDNLKKIDICEVDYSIRQVAFMLCLMRSSPKLSELVIWGPVSQSAILEDLNFVEDYGDRDCSFGQLQTVKLIHLRDLNAEMALIKFLLAHSPMLKQMSVREAIGTDKDKSLSMCKKLMQFGRASPKASLVYLDPFQTDCLPGND